MVENNLYNPILFDTVRFSAIICVSAIINAVNPVFTADLTSEKNRGLGISLLSATGNLGAIIGFGITGVAIQQIGLNPIILIGALLPLVCIGLLLWIGKRG